MDGCKLKKNYMDYEKYVGHIYPFYLNLMMTIFHKRTVGYTHFTM